MKTSFFIITVFITTLWACDPCNDCGPVQQEPTISLFFLNGDSLQITSDSLTIIDTLIYVSDSLTIVNDSIDAGALGYEDEKIALQNFIDGLTSIRLTSSDLSKELNNIKSDLNSIISLIESGSVLIEQLEIPIIGLDSVFTDSLSDYSVPLHLTTEETALGITIASTQYSMLLTYDLFTEVDIDRRVLRRAKNIRVKSHGFDSVLVTCDSANFDCDLGLRLDKETIITCYF